VAAQTDARPELGLGSEPATHVEADSQDVTDRLRSWFADLDLDPADQAAILEALPDVRGEDAYARLGTTQVQTVAAAFALMEYYGGGVLEHPHAREPTKDFVAKALGPDWFMIWPEPGTPFDRTHHEATGQAAGSKVKLCVKPGLATAKSVVQLASVVTE
jgi:hypothetical protein